MESTSDMFPSRSGKFRKFASHNGETERLKKKGREKRARGNERENEQRRRFEENVRRKERMVKLDKKRSGVMDRGDGFLDVHGNKNFARSSDARGERWQMGDGFYVKREATSSVSIKKTKSKFEKRERNKERSKNTKVCVPTRQRGDRKERTKEWVEQVNHTTGRSSTDKLSKDCRLQDVQTSWFINRLVEDVEYVPVKKPFKEVSPVPRPLSAPAPTLANVSDTKGTADTHTVPRHCGVGKKSLGSRVISVLRFFGRCSFGKTE